MRDEGLHQKYVSPEELLKSLGVEYPAEIDLEAIAWECGARVEYMSLDSCEARIIANYNEAIITVNSDTMRERQRFSIGHELGHLMYGHGKFGFACQKRDMSQQWDSHDPEYHSRTSCDRITFSSLGRE